MIPRPGDTPIDTLDKQRKKYGNIVGLFIGTQPTILISGIEDIKEISAREEFNCRPIVSTPDIFAYKTYGNSKFKTINRQFSNYLTVF